MEKAIHFKRGKTYAHSKYPFQHASLSYTPFSFAEGCKKEIGKDSKGFSLGRGCLREENTFDQLEDNVPE